MIDEDEDEELPKFGEAGVSFEFIFDGFGRGC